MNWKMEGTMARCFHCVNIFHWWWLWTFVGPVIGVIDLNAGFRFGLVEYINSLKRWIWTSKKKTWLDWERNGREKSHKHTQRARTSPVFRSAFCCGKGAPLPTSVIEKKKNNKPKKKKLKPKSLLWLQTRVLCFNMNTIFKTGHHLRRTGTGSLLLRHVGPTLKRKWGLSWLRCTGVFLNQLAIRGATQAQTVPCSCPYASPSKGGAQYRYKGNEGWYLHPILETFPKALRFILL